MSADGKKKRVIVTGAASGIGQAAAKLLLADRHSVCALDISPINPSDLAQPNTDRLLCQQTDVSDTAACEKAVAETVAKFGGVDGVIHMAAAHSVEPAAGLTADEFNRTLSVNVTGSFLIARAAANEMIKSGHGGSIVLASSGVVNSGGVGGHGRGGPAYTASKAAIHGLTRSLAKTYGAQGIRVNSVAPGATETSMTADYDDVARQGVAQRTLVGRMGQPHEIANAAIFLVSDAAGYITGENINVNGGGSFGL